MLAIEAIQFNHNTNAAATDALNIRKNATQFLAIPEWQRFLSVNPEDSRAAYAIAQTTGNTVTIQVSLSSTSPSSAFAEVRVEHHVKARPVNFINGQTGFVTFELIDPPVSRGSAGIWDVAWHWEYRLKPGRPWRHFATTRHRIYVVLDIPAAPWRQAPFNAANTQLPWTDVLDYACRWAEGATSTDMAAALVTQAVYALGPSVVTYDCPGGGSSQSRGGVGSSLHRQ